MLDTKSWYRSKTVWGGLAAALASLLKLAGVEIGAELQGELVDMAITAAGAIGGLVAIYGRIRAKSSIMRR